MVDPGQALETQLRNIQTRTGLSLDALFARLRDSGLVKHGELRDFLKQALGMGHGDANTLVHAFLANQASTAGPVESADVIADLYAGKKAGLRPIHEALMAGIAAFGSFELAPKKAYVSLRRKKQFAMFGPATMTRVDLGLNMKDVPANERLVAQAPGGMCQYQVRLTAPEQVDAELLAWIRIAYDQAG